MTSQRVRSASGGWYGGVPDTGPYRVTDSGGDVEVKQFRSAAGEDHVARFNIAVDQPVLAQLPPLVVLGFG